MAHSIKNVLLIGAGGNLGPTICNALDSDSQFTVSVLSRKSSKSSFPSHIKVHTVDDSYPVSELVAAFEGIDAVVSTISAVSNDTQKHFIDAAIQAGVKRFIPAEFGSDTRNPRSQEILPMFKAKVEIVDYLQAQEKHGLTWSALANGPFFDWGLKTGFLGYDLAAHKATIYDSGDTPWPTTTLSTIGLAVTRILQRPEETANQYVHIASFIVSQNEVLAELEKSSGKKWEVEHITTTDAVKMGQEKLSKGDYSGLPPLILAAIYNENAGQNPEDSVHLANETLGLPKETLQEAVAKL